MVFAFYPFRTHVAYSAYVRLRNIQSVFELCANSEVSDFDFSLRIEHQILRFYISVEDFLNFVQIKESGQDLPCDVSNYSFIEFLDSFLQVSQSPSVHEF